MIYTVKWGILATGGIAAQFAKDLLVNPTSRNIHDLKHEVVAVGSSSKVEKAVEFIKSIGASESTTAAYGSYEELVKDPNVDVIYVATPHTFHYANSKLALEAGKHVLCEKPFTVNTEQLKHLRDIAKAKNLFLMEAVWTRYFPAVLDLQKKLFEDKIIGKIHRVYSDFSIDFGVEDLPYSHRMIDPELGGGALLDLGIYALTWVFLINYADPDNKKQPPKFSGSIIKTPRSGVDEHTSITMAFEEGRTMAIATTSMSSPANREVCIRIEGSKGVVTVPWAPSQPCSYKVYSYGDNDDLKEGQVVSFEIPGGGRGMFWEADEVGRCLAAGKLESDRMSLDESILITSIMDKVRYDNDLRYPAHLEAVDDT
jgi:predicted dehydrogenase